MPPAPSRALLARLKPRQQVLFPVEMRHYQISVAEARIVQGPAVLETVLGSCVSAVFWFAPKQIGAMCHGALPECPQVLLRGNDLPKALRYIDFAMYYLLDRLKARGVNFNELEVKLFGGANVLPDNKTGEAIGHRNTVVARQIIEKEGLRLSASDLGGLYGRVIFFRTDTGQVFLRRLNGHEQTEENSRFSG